MAAPDAMREVRASREVLERGTQGSPTGSRAVPMRCAGEGPDRRSRDSAWPNAARIRVRESLERKGTDVRLLVCVRAGVGMRSSKRAHSVAMVAAVAVLAAGPFGTPAEAASRIVDLTLLCNTIGSGYPDPVRYMDVSVAPRLGSGSPTFDVVNGPSPSGVHASLATGPYFSRPIGQLFLARSRCMATSLRVPFSHRGLRGGQTALGARYKCNVPARVVIRVRAVFKRPVTLSRTADEYLARGNIATGTLAVAAAQSRRPIVFASLQDESGKAAVFVARSGCVPNQ